MKSESSSPATLSRYLAASFLLSLLPLTGQTLVNGNFDGQNFATYPGYASGNGGTITGWTVNPDIRVGLNTSGGAFANNGTVPSPANVAFIQAGSAGMASMSTVISDLTIGQKYHCSFRVNARSRTPEENPALVISTDGEGPAVGAGISRVSAALDATPYRYIGYQFVATATSHQLTIANTRTTGDATMLVDDVAVTPDTGSWAIAPWSDDEDCGIDSQYVYTHAVNFATNSPVTINGVNFIGREAGTAGRFLLTDLNSSFGNRTPNNVTGEGAKLARDFRYGGPNSGITLQNLKPNTQYVFTLYGIGFDESPTYYRTATFGSNLSSEKLTVNLNQYGQGNGMLVNYTYTTDALGSPVVISYPNTSIAAGSFHSSGFSNREALASTPPVQWTVEEWIDDETSGVSPSHVYTHAFKFGAATHFNLNGVDFTGLAGGNPAGADFTSANLPNVYNNDANAITGYGSLLARDFVFDGFPEVFNLAGLTPGKDYVFTLYSVGWDDGARPAALIGGVGEQMAILFQDQFGNNQGVRFVYTYTADASGTAKITVGGYDGTKSIHTYGISNREAEAMVGVAPSITLQPTGAFVGVGTPVVLRVGAVGSETLSYQWKRGAFAVGTDSPVIDLGDVDYTDAGSYTVTVSNGVSSVTSDAVNLAVLDNVPSVFGTGLGVDGQPLAAGAIDPHYSLLVNPDNTESSVALVQVNLPGAWLANSPTSKWIGPRADTAAAAALATNGGEGFGNYVYRTQIDLTGFDLSSVMIQGSWLSDNSGLAILVNEVATGLVNDTGVTFSIPKPFVLDINNAPGLIAGVNTIDFVVNNSDAAVGYTGLRVDNLHAIGTIPANTPPHIVAQPTGGKGPHNGTFELAVAASGSAPLAYQWFKGPDAIDGATESTLVLDISDTTAAGEYKVVVSNGVTPATESSEATVTIDNAIPVAIEDNLVTEEGTPLAIDVDLDLIANDTDADGDTLALDTFLATTFNGGTVTLSEGILTYTPAAKFSGLDGFTYTVTDGWGGTSAAGTVLITVNERPEPPPGSLELDVDLVGNSVTGTFSGTPGATYVLQRSITLANDWIDIDTEVAPPSGNVIVEDLDPPAGKAFYRLSYTP